MKEIKTKRELKKVLLLGDSIRLGYQEYVKEILEDRAEVVGPGDNCRFANYTKYFILDWISSLGTPDIVHWNNGLWDVSHAIPNTGTFTPLTHYIESIESILNVLQETRAKIIWAQTTPVLPHNSKRFNNDIDRFNNAAYSFMKGNKIEINDLNSLIRSKIDKYMVDDGVHLNEEGYKACAAQIAESISKFL